MRTKGDSTLAVHVPMGDKLDRFRARRGRPRRVNPLVPLLRWLGLGEGCLGDDSSPRLYVSIVHALLVRPQSLPNDRGPIDAGIDNTSESRGGQTLATPRAHDSVPIRYHAGHQTDDQALGESHDRCLYNYPLTDGVVSIGGGDGRQLDQKLGVGRRKGVHARGAPARHRGPFPHAAFRRRPSHEQQAT